ncbi:Clavaminate synthase-like protein [Calocera viscosa TUFC12733]|uniref:Clavaminate synthase-like protein n=1 Tax=Calocera viscosa (strain TUFC12733) TaxID=1330018 RepID=A0A167RLZ6_CALVF|nr:Clavaminate synthase-like protein [Calocera viscosa TUFC12733]
MTIRTSHSTLPPFPDDIVTAPLVSVSLAKLEADDKAEEDAFFEASKKLGFVYLDMTGSTRGERIVDGAEKLHKIQQEFFKLPNEVKEKYGTSMDRFYAYHYSVHVTRDPNGQPLRNEHYNMRKDDIVGNCERLPCPQMILDNQELLETYVRDCRAVIDLMLEDLNTHLELPPGTLGNLHRITERSGDHARFVQAPVSPWDDKRISLGEHTDFGTLTILFNWLGGLQIRHPETNEWVYVKPVPGCAVVNLGDALVKFTAGILRSNIHRVVPPPGQQAGIPRNSLVYFSRPEDVVIMKRLKGGIIDAQPETAAETEEITSHDWIMRRAHGDLRGIYTAKGFEFKFPEQSRS